MKTHAHLVRALELAMAARCPDIANALEWLRSADGTVDVDDAARATRNAESVLAADLADGYIEGATYDVVVDDAPTPCEVMGAVLEGALLSEEDWDAIDTRIEDELDAGMSDRLMVRR